MASPAPPPLSVPSDVELLEIYLRPRIECSRSFSWIYEEDVYIEDPVDLRARRAPVTTSDGPSWYFFTQVRLKKGFTDRMQRAVDSGRGSWQSERAAKPVPGSVDGEGVVGMKHTFCFAEKGVDGRLNRSGWLMAEFRFGGDEAEPLTLCRMYPTPRGAKAKAAAARARRNHGPSRLSSSAPRQVVYHARSLSANSPPLPLPHRDHAAHTSACTSAPAPPQGRGSSSPPARRLGIDLNIALSPSPEASPSSPAPGPSASPASPPPDRQNPVLILSADNSMERAAPPPPDHCSWMLVEVGAEEDGLRRVFRTQRLEDSRHSNDSMDAHPSPLPSHKRKSLEGCSGWLFLHPAKKPMPDLGSRFGSQCLAI